MSVARGVVRRGKEEQPGLHRWEHRRPLKIITSPKYPSFQKIIRIPFDNLFFFNEAATGYDVHPCHHCCHGRDIEVPTSSAISGIIVLRQKKSLSVRIDLSMRGVDIRRYC